MWVRLDVGFQGLWAKDSRAVSTLSQLCWSFALLVLFPYSAVCYSCELRGKKMVWIFSNHFGIWKCEKGSVTMVTCLCMQQSIPAAEKTGCSCWPNLGQVPSGVCSPTSTPGSRTWITCPWNGVMLLLERRLNRHKQQMSDTRRETNF